MKLYLELEYGRDNPPHLRNFILETELEQMRVLVSHIFLSLPSSFLTPIVFPQHFHQRYGFSSQHLNFPIGSS